MITWTQALQLIIGTSLAVQQLIFCTSTVVDTGSIPGWGTKILHASLCGQKNKWIKQNDFNTIAKIGNRHWYNCVYSSTSCVDSCNYHCNQDIKLFYHHKGFSCATLFMVICCYISDSASLRSIHVDAYINSSFLLCWVICHGIDVHGLPFEGHLGYVQFGAIMNKGVMNICV